MGGGGAGGLIGGGEGWCEVKVWGGWGELHGWRFGSDLGRIRSVRGGISQGWRTAMQLLLVEHLCHQPKLFVAKRHV